MAYQLNKEDRDYIVQQLRLALRKDIKEMLTGSKQPDLVSTEEAAAILRIQPSTLRSIVYKDPSRYPHIKRGEGRNGRLLFDRNALLTR